MNKNKLLTQTVILCGEKFYNHLKLALNENKDIVFILKEAKNYDDFWQKIIKKEGK